MLLSATSNGVGVNVRLVGYGLSVSRYQGIFSLCDVCFASKKSSEWELVVPAGMHLGVKLLKLKFFVIIRIYQTILATMH